MPIICVHVNVHHPRSCKCPSLRTRKDWTNFWLWQLSPLWYVPACNTRTLMIIPATEAHDITRHRCRTKHIKIKVTYDLTTHLQDVYKDCKFFMNYFVEVDCHQPPFGWITNDCLYRATSLMTSRGQIRHILNIAPSFSATLFWPNFQ
jgi:hypothetical protein